MTVTHRGLNDRVVVRVGDSVFGLWEDDILVRASRVHDRSLVFHEEVEVWLQSSDSAGSRCRTVLT